MEIPEAALTQLQHALDKSLKRQHQLESDISALKAHNLPSKPAPFWKLPTEIRREIYKLLQVNPILGTDAAISGHPRSAWGTLVKYQLSTSILYASKET